MIILGLDPGTNRIGYGLIEKDKKLKLIDYGVIEIKETDYSRLEILEKKLSAIIKKYKPDAAAIEKLYFSKNKKTAISVAEARGVILLAISRKKIPIFEYGPNEVKAAVAGNGKSDKKTVERFTAMSLGIDKIKGYDDASDALAIAIRASFERKITY